MLRHLLAEKQLRGSKRLPEYAFSASKEKTQYNFKKGKSMATLGQNFLANLPLIMSVIQADFPKSRMINHIHSLSIA